MFLQFGLAGTLSIGNTQVPDKLNEVDFRVRSVGRCLLLCGNGGHADLAQFSLPWRSTVGLEPNGSRCWPRADSANHDHYSLMAVVILERKMVLLIADSWFEPSWRAICIGCRA